MEQIDEIKELYKLNAFQTPLTKELKDSLHREVWNDLIEYISSVQFIKRIIQPEKKRGYIKDRPISKDFNDNRKEVDIVNPHILEDMDYFRQTAIFFEKHGKYTHLTPNPNPKSDYALFWKHELYKCKHGVVREYDGEWISGELYFYWNFSPIWLVETVATKEGSSKSQGERVRKFPKPWLGDYLFHHYVEQCKRNGKHAKLLKMRGCGMSFKAASWSPRNMYVLPGSGNPNFHLASDKGFISGDKGIWGKIVDCLDWIAEHTPLPRMRLVDRAGATMEIQLGVKDEYGVRKGLLSSVTGISLKDAPEKARGIRGPLIHYEEDGLFPNLETAWGVNRKAVEDGNTTFGFMIAAGCLTENNFVWNNKGDLIKIKDLKKEEGILGFNHEKGIISKENISYWQPPSKKECLRIETNTGRYIECSYDHPILWSTQSNKKLIELESINGKRKRKSIKKVEFREANLIKIGDQLAIADEVSIFNNLKMWEPRLIGWLIGDGSYGFDKTPVLSNCESEINNYIHFNFNTKVEKEYLTKDGKVYQETRIKEICPKLRELGIYGQTKNKKTLPLNIHSYCKEDICELIGGLFDTDGYVSKNGRISFCTAYKSLAIELQLLLQKLGIHGNIIFKKPNFNNPMDRNGYYILEISDKRSVLRFVDNIKLFPNEKQNRLNSFIDLYSNREERDASHIKGLRFERVISIEKLGLQDVYNLTADTTNTYIGNGIITHNTGGTQGASFEGSEKLFYNPGAYNIYGLPNVFDKNATGDVECGFFWGSYLNRKDCYEDDNGEPDVIKALIEILEDRFEVKYNSTDPLAITQKKAEEPITPQEAIMRTEGTLFPVSDLKEHLETIMVKRDSFLAEHYVGELIRTKEGKVKWIPNDNKYPLRSYDKDNGNREGCLEIFEMPSYNANGEIANDRYIFGIDPIDADTGQSLFSIIGLDTFTDRIICEYTGRPKLAEEAYEIALRVIEFYNGSANYEKNLKGLFSYFDKKNALYRLCDTPQVLKDMQLAKDGGYGNNAKGTTAGKEVNKWGRKLHADWMNKPALGFEDGRLGLHTMRGLAHIEEAIKWNSDGNFDRISAAGMLFILREDRYRRIESAIQNQDMQIKRLSDDKFFSKNYKNNPNSY